MKVLLGKFARLGMEARLGADLSVGARAALFHYKRRLKSQWPPLGPPAFSRDAPAPLVEEAFELDVGPEMEAILESEARRHRVSVEVILSHAVLVYLADVDAASQEGVASVSTI